MIDGLSLSGSQVTKSVLTDFTFSPIIPRASEIFSSSSGQISGQCVNPKYINEWDPLRSAGNENGFPVWSVRVKGPPTLGAPRAPAFASSTD